MRDGAGGPALYIGFTKNADGVQSSLSRDETMTSEYHIHGIELSPYSVKVRSYFRYKGIPHRWIPRSLDTEGEYQKFAKLPLVPLVVTPNNEGIQDSTPIIEYVEALHKEPSIHPADPVADFISVLL